MQVYFGKLLKSLDIKIINKTLTQYQNVNGLSISENYFIMIMKKLRTTFYYPNMNILTISLILALHKKNFKKSILNLKVGKSTGPSGILSEMIKCTLTAMSDILLPLYNAILVTSYFPEFWGQSILCPFNKAGSFSDPNNFRVISLIDTLNKILTGMIFNRMTQWAESNDKIDQAQSGFRNGFSTIDNRFTLQSMAQKYLSKKGGRFYCFFVDFSKAFDNINHVHLFNSLIHKGMGGKVLSILISMYSKLTSTVRCGNNNYTDFFSCNIGCRQGCKLSTILFNLFINDLIEELKLSCNNGIHITQEIDDIFAILYADDMANCSDTVRLLQAQINVISNFCDRTGMKINLKKTKIIVFRNGGFLSDNE